MRLRFNSEIYSLLALIRDEVGSVGELYIVGGAVRDALLGLDLHDLDFVMAEDPTPVAKHLARQLKAGFFVLDDDRHTARITYHDPNGVFFPLDFVQFTGENLIEDLNHRDFTINAMAVSILDVTAVIDPLNGQGDLKAGLIRTCGPRSLMEDPVRVLRGVRLSKQFGFDYFPGSGTLMREAAKHLPGTSYERQRDEFFRILAGPVPADGLRDCVRFNVFKALIPHLLEQTKRPDSDPHRFSCSGHSIAVVEEIHHLLMLFIQPLNLPIHPTRMLVMAGEVLGPYAHKISAYFKDEVTPGRTKQGLSFLATLLHDLGNLTCIKPGVCEPGSTCEDEASVAETAWEIARKLKLSNAECDWIRKMVRDHAAARSILTADALPTRRTIYRFFKSAGEVGVAIVVFSLAGLLAAGDPALDLTKWHQTLAVSKRLLSAWWDHKETVVSPKLIMDGHDLQVEFGLKPGKQIGYLLDSLAEAQASGDVQTREEAKAFIREWLCYTSTDGK